MALTNLTNRLDCLDLSPKTGFIPLPRPNQLKGTVITNSPSQLISTTAATSPLKCSEKTKNNNTESSLNPIVNNVVNTNIKNSDNCQGIITEQPRSPLKTPIRPIITLVPEVPLIKSPPKERSLKPSFVSLDDFEILKVLGKGSYGKVYQVKKVRGCEKGRIFAMKSMRKDSFIENRIEMTHTRSERDVLATIDHPFLVRLCFAFETKSRVYLIQEFLRGGELFMRLQAERFFMEDEARFYLSEIVLGLEYLHDNDIVYRDLKSENIMLDIDGHIKLIDFGLCKPNMDDETVTYTFCGTTEYMAPEVITRSGHGKTADWWTFGAFAYDVLTGHSPFHHYSNSKEAVKKKILQCKVNYPKILTHNAIDLIRRLLKKDVEKRLGYNGAEEVKCHKFFKGIDWDMVLNKEYEPPFVPVLKDIQDLSNFDERFTSITPRESVCNIVDVERTSSAADDPFGTMFDGFEYIAPEYLIQCDAPEAAPGAAPEAPRAAPASSTDSISSTTSTMSSLSSSNCSSDAE